MKKIQERAVLDQFKKNCPEFPKGRIYSSESPDFIVKSGARNSIGIELASLPFSFYIIQNKPEIESFIMAVSESLNKKENKLKLYQKQWANSYWLILYVDSLGSGPFNLKEKIEGLHPETGFERVVLFDISNNVVYDVKQS